MEIEKNMRETNRNRYTMLASELSHQQLVLAMVQFLKYTTFKLALR
jgi:hypothetical protein